MANDILTPTMVTREILRVAHQKANFIGTVNRQYDDQFANSGSKGGKIGPSLKIRVPNKYKVRTGRSIDVQETDEESVTLTVSTQKGVDMYFTSADLTLSLQDFSKRIIDPAVSVLVADIESAMIQDIYPTVYQQASNVGSALTYAKLLEGEKKLTDALAPESDRIANLHTQDHADLVEKFSTLFNQQQEIGKQFKTGRIGSATGFDFYRNTHWPDHISGSDDGTGDYLISGPGQTGSTITVGTGTGTLLKGDIITIAGCNRVHPETKRNTGIPMQFVVTESTGVSATSVKISPAIVTSGAKQNVSGSPTDTGAVTKIGGAGAVYDVSMLYHEDAFTFATADLEMPKGVDFAHREEFDGLSIRVVRQYDIRDDSFPCRLDILHGWLATRPEWACRLANN